MSTLTAQDMVRALMQGGMTEQAIAAEIKATQPTINRIKTGESRGNVATWMALNDLYLLKQAERAAQPPASAPGANP